MELVGKQGGWKCHWRRTCGEGEGTGFTVWASSLFREYALKLLLSQVLIRVDRERISRQELTHEV